MFRGPWDVSLLRVRVWNVAYLCCSFVRYGVNDDGTCLFAKLPLSIVKSRDHA